MARKYLDPRITNIFLDSCAFDPKYSPEDKAAMELFELSKEGKIILEVAHSNQKEIDHPNTPECVKKEAKLKICTNETSLTGNERKTIDAILSILAGDGKAENMRQDAEHVYEASKHGSYFVTTDRRILKREQALFELCSVNIVKPGLMLEIYKKYEGT